MTDATQAAVEALEPPANKTIRATLGIVTLGASAALIAYLVSKGTAGNSLHESALAWSFTLIALVLVGFGFGAALPALTNLLPRGK